MRRVAAALLLGLACLAAAAAASAMPSPEPVAANQSGVGSWAEPQIRAVVGRGLMGGSLAAFRPADPLTRTDLSDLLTGLARPDSLPEPGPSEAPASAVPVTMAGLDSRLVQGLGLSAAAARFQSAARAAGLEPPARLGNEA